MQRNIVKYDKLDLTKLSFNNKNQLCTKDGTFVIQSPEMTLNWNILCTKFNNKEKYSISLTFKGMENDDDLMKFFKLLKNLDNFILKYIIRNKNKLFQKEINNDMIKKSYTPLIKVSLDKDTKKPDNKYPPSLKVNIPYKNNNFETIVFNSKKEQVNFKNTPIVSILVKDLKVKLLIKMSNIWVMENKSGCSLSASQIKLTETHKKIKNYSFLENSDESEDEYDVDSEDDDSDSDNSGDCEDEKYF